MFKRLLTVLFVVTVVFGLALPGSATRTIAAPVTNGPNANLLPANTALYIDFRTADLKQTISFFQGLAEKVSGQPLGTLVYDQLDKGLTDALKRPATFEKDVLSWLGDHITVGLPISDEAIAAAEANDPNIMTNVLSNPDLLAIISVKDDAAAASFFKDLLATVPANAYTTRTGTMGSDTLTIYDFMAGRNSKPISAVQAKGFVALGTNTSIDAMLTAQKNKSATLADDASFGKIVGGLKANNLITMYISPRLYQIYIAAAQSMMARNYALTGVATPEAGGKDPMAVMRGALSIIKGQAFGARMDGKLLAFDIVNQLDMAALTKFYTDNGMSADFVKTMQMAPIQGALAAQIPAKAVAVTILSGLPKLYDALQQSLKMMQTVMPAQMTGGRGAPDIAQIQRGIAQVEAAIKLAFDLDVRQDILSWMTGEFALYMVYNPDSVLTKASKNSPWPFDHTLLIQTGDKAKTTNFITKLNAGIEKNAGITPEQGTGDVYTVTDPKSSVSISYGLVNDTFFITTGSGLNTTMTALKG